MSDVIKAKLFYGLPYSNLSGKVERLDDKLDVGKLAYASPYYDAPRAEWIVGVEAGDEFGSTFELEVAAIEAEESFADLTGGLKGRFFVCNNVF